MANESQNTEQLRARAAFILSQARAQSVDIESALAAASGSGTLHARLAAAAARISGAIDRLSLVLDSTSFPLTTADLVGFESAVSSAEVSDLVKEATSFATTGNSASALANASAAAREEVRGLERDVFDRHIFNPYLHFSSAEDEAAFRQREAETRRYVDEQLALQTADGDLRAAEALKQAMRDAGKHGATASPEYAPDLNRLDNKIEGLRTAMHADEHAQRTAPPKAATERQANGDIDFAAMDAKLDAAGLRPAPDTQTTGHGLSVQKPPGRSGTAITD